MRTIGDEELNRRAPVEQFATADIIPHSPSSSNSLFPSLSSSPFSFQTERIAHSSSTSPVSLDVVPEAFASNPAPTSDNVRARKNWTQDMNKFIWRNYLIITNLERNTRGHLTSLHQKFVEQFPEMDVSKQRLGDQRRAIINNHMLSQTIIEEIRKEVTILLNQQPLPSNQIDMSGSRMSWSNEINESILRIYYEVTEIETNMIAYRKKLHKKFIEEYPNLSHITEQRLSDQRRAIVNNKMIPSQRILQIKKDAEEKLHINNISYSPEVNDISISLNYTSSTTCDQSQENMLFTENEENNRTHSDTNPTITSSAMNTLNPAFQDIIKERFVEAWDQFKHTDPTTRPYIPRQKTSRKLAMIVNYINKNILPGHLNTELDFVALQTLIYTAAYTVATCNGTKINTNNIHKFDIKVPSWQKRLEKKIDKLRSNIGRLVQYMNGNRRSQIVRTVESIKVKYSVHAQHENINTNLEHFLDTLKQKLNIASNRLRRYTTCTIRKNQNKQFRYNEKSFYRNLVSLHTSNQLTDTPLPETLRQFWANIWENTTYHNNNAEWIDKTEEATTIPNMIFDHIPVDIFLKVIQKTHNWKSPGTDNIHNYWYKKFTCTHPYIHNHINTFITSPDTMPTYITQGVTYMLSKDKNDLKNPAKYRPITCLQTIYKILTACISEMIYLHISENDIMAEQQKGCKKNSQGCKEQLTIDAIIMNRVAKKKLSIYSMFIDYQKAFDSVPHSWLKHVLHLYKIDTTIINFLEITMQKWETVLSIKQNNQPITTEPIKIKRGIFQGDALSPLWFCLALNPLSTLLNNSQNGFKINNQNTHYTLSHLLYMDDIKLIANSKDQLFRLADITQQFSQDIQMQFGVDKCKVLSIERGKVQNNSYILQSGEPIEPMEEQSTYKYLGFQQSRRINQKETKEELSKKFKHRLNIILKTHLNSKNTVKAINTFAIPILTYSFGIIHWSQTDLKKLQRTINTHLTKYRKHHPKSCIQRLTLSRQEGGRGLIDIQNLHNKQIQTLRQYFHNKSQYSLLHQHITKIDDKLTPLNLQDLQKQPNEHLIDPKEKISAWSAKALHGRHRSILCLPHVDKEKSNEWLKKGELFPETEGFMVAIQDETIATRNYIKYIIKDVNQTTDMCRHCNSTSETIQHITGACSAIAQTDYKHRHDQVAAIIHQNLAYQHNFVKEMTPYYKYKPETILENQKHKIYWDRTILTDKTIYYNRPDITLHDKESRTIYLIDIAIPNSHNIQKTISEKLSKYQELAIELKSQWKANTVHIVPIVLSSTGIIPKSLAQSLSTLKIPLYTSYLLQKATVLNTCRITRKFLSSSSVSSNFSI
ncbi:uncharacterized protein LOC132902746 [Amyelois transitella]|uniref:uncharacterized protein LOC132902746 n=1 Tax=Amyelois transitella TaxID=680683 RepID=UPI00298F5565|nr:uncharacterized protein LOC132902746 [Amyelois transitella]